MEDQPSGVDPFDLFDTFFGRADELFGDGNKGGINFNFRNNRNLGCDIRGRLKFPVSRHVISVTAQELNQVIALNNAEIVVAGGEMKSQRIPFGMMSQCGGLGKMITDHCRKCDGSGQVKSKQTMEVAIPPGDTMQIQGEGNFDEKRLAAS
ncbi:hypothetical protein RJT34_04999 [Clitoria ternatea]|uniref:Chaperone DnaJ C-terminal domain-containing protein n=1 Tax=Clitoria ternatea TaxID=43366 RepID=A0AAN9K0L0_CLITE